MSLFDFGQANNAQKDAVLQTDGPVLIIAGPGTGKTYNTAIYAVAIIENKSLEELFMEITKNGASFFFKYARLGGLEIA